jgi:hypothetical protein
MRGYLPRRRWRNRGLLLAKTRRSYANYPLLAGVLVILGKDLHLS